LADNRLTALKVAKIGKPGRYGDGGGLYLRVAEYPLHTGELATSKNWVFRFERAGRERLMGLGSLNTLTLAEARELARGHRKTLLDGRDPIEDRRERKREAALEAARTMTFRACAEAYIAAHRPGWKNPKHAGQWPATLSTYVYPVVGQLSVAAVDTTLVIKCLNPIWIEKSDTAGRVRGRIEAILDWAKARGLRTGDNPARWRGHLKKLLPAREKIKRQVRHHPALPFVQAPEFMAKLRRETDLSSRALEFLILTAARTVEVIAARWSTGEVDFKHRIWTVPADRMKAGVEHKVPLSRRAIAILKTIPRVDGNDFIFPGSRECRPLSSMAMLEKLRGMLPGLTVHGFRSTFRDWAGDKTNHPREVIEAALAHTLESETEAAYRRSTAIEKRRRLMEDWAAYCARQHSPRKGR
jgi:integrase